MNPLDGQLGTTLFVLIIFLIIGIKKFHNMLMNLYDEMDSRDNELHARRLITRRRRGREIFRNYKNKRAG